MKYLQHLCLLVAFVLAGSSTSWASQALTVITYNIGQTPDPAAQIQLIKDNHPNPPDVIVFQEIYESQFNTYKAQLASKYPGYTWNSAPHLRHCWTASQPNNCTYNGTPTCTAGTEGVGIFVRSSLTIVSTEPRTFWYGDTHQAARGGLRVALQLPNGTVANVFAVHAPTSSCARTNMLNELKAWAATVATPRFLAGDFNDPDREQHRGHICRLR